MTIDPTRYRVNLLCSCKNDLIYGYGGSIAEARKVAQREFRKHWRADHALRVVEEIVEVAVDHGFGSHYEEVP